MNKSKALKELKNHIKNFRKSMKDGKYYEVGYHSSGFIDKITNILEGKADNVFISMIDYMAGQRRVPLKGKYRVELLKLKEECEALFKESKEKDKCKHNWLFEQSGGDLLGVWIDVVCGKCKSSITLRESDRFTCKEFARLANPLFDKCNGDIHKIGNFLQHYKGSNKK